MKIELSVEDQALLRKVSTTFREDRPVWRGETGTTYGGAGYSPLYRSVTFLQPKNQLRYTKPLFCTGKV